MSYDYVTNRPSEPSKYGASRRVVLYGARVQIAQDANDFLKFSEYLSKSYLW